MRYTLALALIVLGWAVCHKSSSAQPCEDKALRDHLSEKQIDKMVADSFPASDPPSTY